MAAAAAGDGSDLLKSIGAATRKKFSKLSEEEEAENMSAPTSHAVCDHYRLKHRCLFLLGMLTFICGALLVSRGLDVLLLPPQHADAHASSPSFWRTTPLHSDTPPATKTAPSPRGIPPSALPPAPPQLVSESSEPGGLAICLRGITANGLQPRFHPNEASTWTDAWDAGLGGGLCVCPDGQEYQAGDEGSQCTSIACHGGSSKSCYPERGPWTHRKVVCGELISWQLELYGHSTTNGKRSKDVIVPLTDVGADSQAMHEVCFDHLAEEHLRQYTLEERVVCFRLVEALGSWESIGCTNWNFVENLASRHEVAMQHNILLSFSAARQHKKLPPLPPMMPAPSNPPASPHSPGPPPPSISWQLSVDTCERAFRQPSHLFRKMWDLEERMQHSAERPACWEIARDCQGSNCHLDNTTYWEEARSGTHCGDNWYSGSMDAHGNFRTPAAALLGFDGDIHRVCPGNCDYAGFNILQLFDPVIKYNTCRNFEWQICAAKGKLRYQKENLITFALAPKELNLHGNPPFGCCSGWTDRMCSISTGFANDDIYYLEVCLYSQICSNRESLFTIDSLKEWRCDFDDEGFDRLVQLLRGGPSEGELGGVCDVGAVGDAACPNGLYQQCGGQFWNGLTCCKTGAQCVGDMWYKQCRP
ncbi:hypothetical protein AB1Y20_019066 [Prymnesium parvum]|uniref:CBM1 domain-containing protein n=1 Tax=Prymnesium parvum TaxID=97485 RepID=A0AB34JT98_PRYPA